MKNFLLLLALSALVQGSTCNKKPGSNHCFKGRLEIKGICMNYTMSVIEGTIDPNLVESSWLDPNTGKTYKNAFRLEHPCSFPASIKEGDEFYFEIDPAPEKDCAVCRAYYPTPTKPLSIKITSACP
jgi:hypothetical protein